MALATVVIHETQSVGPENVRKSEIISEASLVADAEEITSLSPVSHEPSVLSMVSLFCVNSSFILYINLRVICMLRVCIQFFTMFRTKANFTMDLESSIMSLALTQD